MKGLVSSDVHCRDVYDIEIGNTVREYMYLFNTYSDRNRGRGYRGRGCRIFGTNRLSAVEGFSCYRGINCIGFSILETNRTVGNREDQY